MKWEYNWVRASEGGHVETLNTEGAKGWEAYAVSKEIEPSGRVFLLFHMKRPTTLRGSEGT